MKPGIAITIRIVVKPELSWVNALKLRLAGKDAAVEIIRQMADGMAKFLQPKDSV